MSYGGHYIVVTYLGSTNTFSIEFSKNSAVSLSFMQTLNFFIVGDFRTLYKFPFNSIATD